MNKRIVFFLLDMAYFVATSWMTRPSWNFPTIRQRCEESFSPNA